jgi:hypothetical protein
VLRITSISQRITLCKLRCSAVMTGWVRLLIGGVRVGSLGLFMRFISVLWTLIAVIGRFGVGNGKSYSTGKNEIWLGHATGTNPVGSNL